MSSIVIGLILLSVLVVAHEFGHFIVAKKSGILVEEFALGMGPKLISHTWGETEYSLRVFPLGGFCRMQDEQEYSESERGFSSKPAWVRFLVLFAGPFMNFLLALILIFGLTATTYVVQPIVDGISPGTPAESMGLEIGDRIYSINGKRVHIYDEMQMMMYDLEEGEQIDLEILRDGTLYAYRITPAYSEETGRYLVGFQPLIHNGLWSTDFPEKETASIAETMIYSFHSMIYYIKSTAEGLVSLFTFTADSDDVGGPIAIFKLVGDSYEAGLTYSLKAAIQNVVYIGAVLSANLGVLNLFPIPALDGGRIIFILIEAIRRKPMDAELEGKIHFLGFMFLITLMVLVAYSDIMKFVL